MLGVIISAVILERRNLSNLKFTQSEVKHVGPSYEIQIQYQDGTKQRREIFAGRTIEETNRMVTERRAELKRREKHGGENDDDKPRQ
jgi:hypothetical protein